MGKPTPSSEIEVLHTFCQNATLAVFDRISARIGSQCDDENA